MDQTRSEDTSLSWWTNMSVQNRSDVSSSAFTEEPTFDTIANNLEPIISNEEYKTAQRVIECGFLPLVGLLGLPANIINMAVFCRQGLRDKMNLCLFTLASVDFMYLLCMFLTTFYCVAVALSDVLWEMIIKWYIRIHIMNFIYAFWYCSGMLTAIIATERCICVTWPMKSATIFSTKTMACLIFGAIIIINILCLPYVLKPVITWESNERGDSFVVIRETAIYHDHKLLFDVVSDTILPIISFLTFFIVSFVTVVTVRKLRTAMDWRQKTSGHVMDKRQLTLVKMLITISCVYIACNAPKLSLAIVRLLVREFALDGTYRNMFFATHRAGHGLLMLSSSVNVFIYYKQSSRFRKELHCMFPFCKDQPEKDVNL